VHCTLTLADEALGAIARKAIDRKTGARGLCSIMEGILLDTIFDLPSLEGVEEVVISREVVEGTAWPLYIYAARAGDAGASPSQAANSLPLRNMFGSVTVAAIAVAMIGPIPGMVWPDVG
jgi:hypothetical protein